MCVQWDRVFCSCLKAAGLAVSMVPGAAAKHPSSGCVRRAAGNSCVRIKQKLILGEQPPSLVSAFDNPAFSYQINRVSPFIQGLNSRQYLR